MIQTIRSRSSAVGVAATLLGCTCGALASAGLARAESTYSVSQADGKEPRLGVDGPAQGADQSPAEQGRTSADVLAQADPAAAAAWSRMLAASRAEVNGSPLGDGATPAPPQSFHLQANVITREGVNTNQLEVDYRFLSPHYVRFLLPSNRQTGRGSGQGLSAYWLKDGDEVQRLETRDNKEDRRLVNEMVALARNFLALTDPERIRLTRLDLLEGPPVALPKNVKREIARAIKRAAEASKAPGHADKPSGVSWIRLSSPDFDLVRRGDEARDARRDQLVSLAIGPEGLPLVAVVQDPSAVKRPLTGDASLISLGSWVVNNEFRVPYHIQVYRPELVPATGDASAWAFAQDPVQDIALSKADLRPDFVPTDFDPQ